ncbi:MAG: cytosine permease [Hyphomonadaceae bacterium]|nr:cytosine permease [Hyphomonadaceae bacterium]
MSEIADEFEAVAIGDDHLTPWWRVAAVGSMVAFSLPTFITGLEVYQGLSPWQTVWALLIGSLLIFAIGSAMGGIGAQTRMSSYLLTRIAFGDHGAGVVNLAFAISLLGWFGININLFADAVSGLSTTLFGGSPSNLVLSLIAAACMTGLTFAGFKAINLLATLMVPVLALVTVILAYNALTLESLPQLMAAEKATTLSVGEGISAIVGAIIIGAIILPDITRFVRSWRGALGVTFISYMIVQLFVMAAASLASGATGSGDILEIMLQFGLGLGAFIIVITGSWVLNALNLYSTVLSIKATFPKLSQTLLIIGLGVFGAGAALLNLLDVFIEFLIYLSIIFIPVAGVVIADYILVRRAHYRIESLDQNRKFAPKAFGAWAIGAVASLIMYYYPSLSPSGISAIDAIALTAFSYLGLAWTDRSPAPSTQTAGD